MLSCPTVAFPFSEAVPELAALEVRRLTLLGDYDGAFIGSFAVAEGCSFCENIRAGGGFVGH